MTLLPLNLLTLDIRIPSGGADSIPGLIAPLNEGFAVLQHDYPSLRPTQSPCFVPVNQRLQMDDVQNPEGYQNFSHDDYRLPKNWGAPQSTRIPATTLPLSELSSDERGSSNIPTNCGSTRYDAVTTNPFGRLPRRPAKT